MTSLARLPKPRRFFYHFNKPASAAAGTPKLSIHYEGKCHVVDHIDCATRCESHHQNRQPHCIMRGMARNVLVTKDSSRGLIAIIN